MMDNRVAAIKDILHKNGFGGKVSVVFVFLWESGGLKCIG